MILLLSIHQAQGRTKNNNAGAVRKDKIPTSETKISKRFEFQMMDAQERYEIIAEFDNYLESGMNDATPDQLRRWLFAVKQGSIANEAVRHRAIINGITINYLLMERAIRQLEETIKQLDTENDHTQRLVITLTYVTIFVGIAQVIVPLLFP